MQLNSDVVNSVLRHVGTSAGTVFTVFTVLGFLSPDDAQKAITALHKVTDGLQQAFGGISQLALILGPAFAGTMAWFAGTASTLKAQLTKVVTNKKVEIDGTISAPADVAAAVPSDKVVPK